MLSLNELTCGAGKCLGHTNTIGLCHPPLVCLPLTFSSSPKWSSIQHELQAHECNQITFGWSERKNPLQLAFPAFYELTKVIFLLKPALIAWRLKMLKNDPIARKTEEAVDGRNHRRHACSGRRPRGHPRPIPNVENRAMQEERLFLLKL